ncbi:hypothetical protein ACERZ8_08515 [Tateyamaria armeniaca]|uniref:Secreted protein n=1 Tax=Tateyamaria armeniaca TaxID=2518930 RepID=A0ABW8UW60_9RHOB
MRLIPLLLFLATPVAAQDWAFRSSDTVLDRSAVLTLVEGHTLIFFDDGQSKFSAGGAHSYTYANGGGTAFGRFDVAEDGLVCIAYRNGFSRCDRYVENAGRYVLLTEKGERFPIRP